MLLCSPEVNRQSNLPIERAGAVSHFYRRPRRSRPFLRIVFWAFKSLTARRTGRCTRRACLKQQKSPGPYSITTGGLFRGAKLQKASNIAELAALIGSERALYVGFFWNQYQ